MLLAAAPAVPAPGAPAALSSRGSATAPTSGWALDPRIAESPGQLSGCPNGQRNAAESECLAAVQEATHALGRPMRGLKVVDEGADGVVPGGCSYSFASKRGVFNRNSAGRSSPLYQLVCERE